MVQHMRARKPSVSPTAVKTRDAVAPVTNNPGLGTIRPSTFDEKEGSNAKPLSGFAKRLRDWNDLYVPACDANRALGTMSPISVHRWSSDQRRRASYLCLAAKNSTDHRANSYGHQLNRFEIIPGDCSFLRALEDLWESGNKILSSIRTRMHDVDYFDIRAADVFFSSLDNFVLWYYDRTSSSVDARKTVILYHNKMRCLRQKLRRAKDIFVLEAFLFTAERARDAALNIARWEAAHGEAATMKKDRRAWKGKSVSVRIAAFMLLRGMAIDGNELQLAAQYIGMGRGAGRIRCIARRLSDIDRVAETFERAEIEYRELYASCFSALESNSHSRRRRI